MRGNLALTTPKASRVQALIADGVPVPDTAFLHAEDVDRLSCLLGSGAFVEAADALWATFAIDAETLAIRSSYAEEDGELAAAAGSYSSLLGVLNDPASVGAALRTLLQELADIRKHRPTAKLEVIVQAHVRRQVHGVAFTADPVTGNADYSVISTTLQSLDVTAGADSSTCYAALAGDEVDIAWGRTDLSSNAQRELLVLLQRMRGRFGGELDVEFGALGDQLYVFQARPITAMETRPLVRFHDSDVADIAAPYKEVYSRHRRKRHLLYSEVMGTEVRFPRSIVVDKHAGDSVRTQINLEVETPVVLVPASDVLRPRRKEDFRTIRADSLQEALGAAGGGQHLLITESPQPEFSGHLAKHGETWLLEWVCGGLERLNADVEVHRVFGGESTWPSHLNRRSIALLIERIERRFPGTVVEWMQDGAGVVWIYDATLSSGGPKPLGVVSRDTGKCVDVGDEQIQALRKLIKLPMSVYAEHDEVKEALQLDLAGVVPGVPASGDFFISASYPAMELAPFVFYPGMRGFVLRRGSILCHLALIARERGLVFRIASA